MMMHMEMSSSLDQDNKMKSILGYEEHHDDDDDDDSFSSDVSSVVSSDDESDDTFEEINSSSSSSNDHSTTDEHVLGDMSSLLQELPSKRGLSKYFQGKSQSFTSLSKVMCLEDLAKPENPYNKKMKSCKSYVGLSSRSASSSKLFTKKMPSRASCSSFSNDRPPTHTNRATNNQTSLFV